MSLFFRLPCPDHRRHGDEREDDRFDPHRRAAPLGISDVVVAGNMGVSALDQLPRAASRVAGRHRALSSWQLEALIEHGLAPRIAVLTLIAEDHLNTYDGFADYAATKRGITRHQRPDDWLVVNRDDPERGGLARRWRRSFRSAKGDRGDDGAWLTAEGLLWRWQGSVERRWPRPTSPALVGRHGARNALAALAAAKLAGGEPRRPSGAGSEHSGCEGSHGNGRRDRRRDVHQRHDRDGAGGDCGRAGGAGVSGR